MTRKLFSFDSRTMDECSSFDLELKHLICRGWAPASAPPRYHHCPFNSDSRCVNLWCPFYSSTICGHKWSSLFFILDFSRCWNHKYSFGHLLCWMFQIGRRTLCLILNGQARHTCATHWKLLENGLRWEAPVGV